MLRAGVGEPGGHDGAMTVVAVLGAGVMGETLVSGLLRAGRRPEQMLLAERRPERAAAK